jgi:hypothetical protein
MIEDCKHCGGGCYPPDKSGLDSKTFCEFCGGSGVNTWIGNMMGKPETIVYDVVLEILSRFSLGPKVDITKSTINEILEEEFRNTNIIVEFEKFEGMIYYFKTKKRIRG